MAKIKTVHGIKEHKVVSEKEWVTARKALLVKEKKFSRLRDELNRQRRELPWVKLEKEYAFEGPGGKVTLAKGEPLDRAYLKAVENTLSEWTSAEDKAAYDDL